MAHHTWRIEFYKVHAVTLAENTPHSTLPLWVTMPDAHVSFIDCFIAYSPLHEGLSDEMYSLYKCVDVTIPRKPWTAISKAEFNPYPSCNLA